jgi:hypothetical protein
MNLVFALDQLRKARRLVKDGQKSMVRQRETVARLESRGHDATEALLFLEYLEEMQAKYEVHREQVEKQVLGLVKPTDDD